MSILTHKPKLPPHARSPTWSKPREPQQVSNSEVLARHDPQGEHVGLRWDDSYLGFQWIQEDGEGFELGYDRDAGMVRAGLATDMGELGVSAGVWAPWNHDRSQGLGIGISVRPKLGDIDFGFNIGNRGGTIDDTEVIHEGATVLVRRRMGVHHEGTGGVDIMAGSGGGGAHNALSAERTRRISTPEWIALCAENGNVESEAARALISPMETVGHTKDLEDGESYRRSFEGGIGFQTSISAGADLEYSAGVDHRNELAATRQGSTVTLTSTAVIGGESALATGVGLQNLFVQSRVSTSESHHYDTTGRITLDVEKDADLIAEIETTLSAEARLALIVEHGGTVSATHLEGDGITANTQLVVGGADRGLNGVLGTEITEDGRRNFTADSELKDAWTFLGHTFWGDSRENRASLQQGEDGRYSLDLQALDTHTDGGLGLDEFDPFAPAGMVVDLFTTETVDQTAGLSLDADQLDAVIAMAGQDAWSNGGNSRYGGPADAWWMALGRQLRAADKLPERERRSAQARAIAVYIRAGGEAEAFERLLDPDHDGKVEGATLTEWPESLVDGAARYEALEAQVDAPDPEQTAALLIDIDLFTYQVAACSDFTMAGAKSDLLERLGDMRDRVSHRRYEELGENYDFDLDFDAAYAQLRTGLGICRAYAGDESRMFSDLDSAHDKEAAVEKLSKFYARWRGAVLNVRECYESLALRPENWKVSAPGGERTDYEPNVDRIARLWGTTSHATDTAGLRDRIFPSARYA